MEGVKGELDSAVIGREFGQISNLYGRWSFAIDHGHPRKVLEDFAPDGKLWVSDRGAYQERGQIGEILDLRGGQIRHVITNVFLEEVQDTTARSHAYFDLVRVKEGDVVARGVYNDSLMRSKDRWLWQVKAVHFLWRAAAYSREISQLGLVMTDIGPNPVGGPWDHR